MRFLYYILIPLLFSSNVFAFENIIIPNENSSFSQAQSLISNEDLETLEKQILKKIYKNEPSLKRLSRLEKEIFGMEQNGDIEQRYENLLTAAEYYNSGYRKNENIIQQKNNSPQYYTYDDTYDDFEYIKSKPNKTQYYSKDIPEYYESKAQPQKQSKIKQFFNDLAEVLSAGVVTGYTPPVYYNDFDILGGSSLGYPQIPQVQTYINIPQPNYYSHVHYPYNKYSNPYYPRRYYPQSNRTYRYNRVHPNYRNYRPYGNGTSRYGSGSGVHIIN